MSVIKVQPKSAKEQVAGLSGLFITKDNPKGLTVVERTLIAALLFTLPGKDAEITKEAKEAVANLTNNKFQIITNYLAKLRKKGVIVNNKLHPVFYTTTIIEQWKR